MKYLPTKESVYEAALESCRDSSLAEAQQRLLDAPASSRTLVELLRFLLWHVVLGARDADRDAVNRLLLRSLCEDGEFARRMFGDIGRRGPVAKIGECLQAAAAAGDLVEPSPSPATLRWLAHHTLFAMMAMELPQPSAVTYNERGADLLDTTVGYVLRGLGFTPDAIVRSMENAD